VAGTAWAFGIDAITFVVSVVSLAAMRITAQPAPATGDSVLGDVKAGLRYTRSQPWLWWSMVALGIANVVSFVPIVVLEALLVKNVFKGGSLALGTLYASNGLGRSLAAGYVKRRGAPRRRLLAMWLAWSAEGVFALLLGLSPTVWTAAICVGAVGVCGSYGNVIWFPTMQERIPRDLLGRVSSLDWLLSLALAPLGTVLGGALAGVAGVRLTLVVGGALAMCTGGVLFVPGVRDPDRHAVGLGETR
jgi:hypothetical protein